ncbi:hypothetical protein INR77_04075 [Erythrobacter sp. SCSIO 43205]|uniref:hypothetical protein n=1 Tax=Erythrobacter sp. SCSIO 43205 TaxID=2779361 RepID=UPI001CA8F5EC|nr:hypothetical protein [Erythrobacter sp. SCSIO 43205]UAB78891.1 hypothetical protein INR77_04075 [Erythrobacter sp. SCSIO 43205]
MTVLVTATLKLADQAPSPTCPFIKNQQCQRAAETVIADSDWFPDLHRGSRLSVYLGDRSWRAVEAVSAASVEPIYAWFGIRARAFCGFVSKNLQATEKTRLFVGFKIAPRMLKNRLRGKIG